MRIAVIAAFLLTCLAVSNAQEQAGTVIFYREPHAMTGDFKPAVYCDGEELARIENGTSFEVTATAGVHRCTAESPQQPGAIEVSVVAGKTVYVHVNLKQGWTRHAVLANTTEDEYENQKSRLKPVKEWSRNTISEGLAESGTETVPTKETSSKPPKDKQDLAESRTGTVPAKQTGGKPPKDKHAGRFGDLAVSVTNLK